MLGAGERINTVVMRTGVFLLSLAMIKAVGIVAFWHCAVALFIASGEVALHIFEDERSLAVIG